MKERPILFNKQMATAIYQGHKTQTRRIVKPPWELSGVRLNYLTHQVGNDRFVSYKCPYGTTGDRLWVRETWEPVEISMGVYGIKYMDGTVLKISHTEGLAHAWGNVFHPKKAGMWRPSIHMPRWASRLWLEIGKLGFQRLQDISMSDAFDEGMLSIRSPEFDMQHWPEWRCVYDAAIAAGKEPPVGPTAIETFQALWDSLYAHTKGQAWEDNPLVWVVPFKKLDVQYAETLIGKNTPSV